MSPHSSCRIELGCKNVNHVHCRIGVPSQKNGRQCIHCRCLPVQAGTTSGSLPMPNRVSALLYLLISPLSRAYDGVGVNESVTSGACVWFLRVEASNFAQSSRTME